MASLTKSVEKQKESKEIEMKRRYSYIPITFTPKPLFRRKQWSQFYKCCGTTWSWDNETDKLVIKEKDGKEHQFDVSDVLHGNQYHNNRHDKHIYKVVLRKEGKLRQEHPEYFRDEDDDD
jgi:hypothetical protein